ncbi:MAG: hypothetical protein K6F29_01045, partial [Bacteroidales bacterium]|nr:hypothetical protein [Bacteroidales bacterium]
KREMRKKGVGSGRQRLGEVMGKCRRYGSHGFHLCPERAQYVCLFYVQKAVILHSYSPKHSQRELSPGRLG